MRRCVKQFCDAGIIFEVLEVGYPFEEVLAVLDSELAAFLDEGLN